MHCRCNYTLISEVIFVTASATFMGVCDTLINGGSNQRPWDKVGWIPCSCPSLSLSLILSNSITPLLPLQVAELALKKLFAQFSLEQLVSSMVAIMSTSSEENWEGETITPGRAPPHTPTREKVHL